MRASSYFESRFLKATDIPDEEMRLVIARVHEEDIDGTMKLVVKFKGLDKGLVLNKTNADVLVLKFGDETTDWVDQVVNLVVERVQYKGEFKNGIRVKPIRRDPPPTPVPASGPRYPDLDDTVPF